MRGSSRSALARRRVAERLEERRHALDVHRLVERGKGARQHQPVFQRIARARRRLGAVAQHPPAPVGPAADIGGIDAEIAAARRFDAAHRAQIFGAAGNRRGRHRALGHQAALAIEVAQHQLQQLRALRDARGQLLPVGLVDQERQVAQRPQPVGGLAGRAIGDAGFAQMPVGGAEAPLDIGRASARAKASKNRVQTARGAPSWPIYSSGIPGSRDIVAGPLRDAPLARTGLASLTACPAFLAVASRHPDSPASEPILNAGAASSSRGSKGIQLCVLRGGGSILPGVWPWSWNRASRRASAS